MRSIRDLLRQIGRPSRLRRDPIASHYLARSDRQLDAGALVASAERRIRALIAELPPRCRIVLERTEFDGQSVADVAKALSISERQVYRDRATAFRTVAQRFSHPSEISDQPGEISHQPIEVRGAADIQLSHARMLEQVGQLETAAAVLRDLADGTNDPRYLVGVYCTLARLAFERGNSTEARSYGERAVSSALASGGDISARAEAHAVLGDIALAHGRPDAASQLLERSSAGLRTQLRSSDHERATGALVRALISLSASYSFSGQFHKARAAITEAQLRLGESARSDQLLQLAVRVQMAAASHFLGNTPLQAESELRACFDTALGSGFILTALDISVYLSIFYRFRNANDLAVKLMESLLSISKSVSASRTKAHFYATLASALGATGEAVRAEEMLSYAVEATGPEQPDVEAALLLVATRTKLMAGAFDEAVAASARSEVLFTEMGRSGSVGVSLHLRSLALAALGRQREALQTAQDAVDALSVGHPDARRLALRTLATLRRNRVGQGRGLVR